MLAEEAQEFKDGMIMYFNVIRASEDHMEAIVEMVDAWADYQFVAQGTYFKHLGSDVPFDFDWVRSTENYMYFTLTKQLKIEPGTLEKCLKAVIDANNAKGTEKVNGKIQKGPDWRDPKETIFNILKEDGVL
jgi:hypothetical protein